MELQFKFTGGPKFMICRSYSENRELVSKCKINTDIHKWTISEFFTEKQFMHMGFGKVTMKTLIDRLIYMYGEPSIIEYIWNGANEYVLDWITKEFNAVCQCPITVQKTQTDDDWSSHMYTLDKDKVLKYFKG